MYRVIGTLYLLFICTIIHAQGHFPVIAMELQTSAISGNVVNGQPDISDSTVFNIVMKVVISDTSSMTSLQVVLRKDVNDPNSLLSKTFTYDVAGILPDGTSYTRNGYEISLVLGDFMGTIDPYAELTVSNSNGNTTDPIIYY
jgi:hypothetical protein